MDISHINLGQRYKVTLPGEEVDGDGQTKIIGLLAKAYAAKHDEKLDYADLRVRRTLDEIENWTWRWQQPNGRYAGNLTKRLSSFAYKELQLKLEPKIVTEIGNLAKNHSPDPADYWFDITDDLNWKRGLFGDIKSCFAVGDTHTERLIALGCLAVRLYKDEKGGGVGRMWLYPWSGDTENPQPADPKRPTALIGFNGYGQQKKDYVGQVFEREDGGDGDRRQYGEMQTLDYARLLAVFLGVSYAQIRISAMGKTKNDGPMYFNNAGKSAVIVGPVEIVEPYKARKNGDGEFEKVRVDLKWSDALLRKLIPVCPACHNKLNKTDALKRMRKAVNVPGYAEPYCEQCVRDHFDSCQVCGELHLKNEMSRWTHGNTSLYYCAKHRDAHAVRCVNCGRQEHLLLVRRVLLRNKRTERLQFGNYCRNCFHGAEGFFSCGDCGVNFIPTKGKDDLYEKLAPGPLLVRCPRCKAKGKKAQAAGLAEADADEEIDPVEAVYAPDLAQYATPFRSYTRLFERLQADGYQPIDLMAEGIILKPDQRIPPRLAYRGHDWLTLHYRPNEGSYAVVTIPDPNTYVRSREEGIPLKNCLILDDANEPRHCIENALALAVYLGLMTEPEGGWFDPITHIDGYWRLWPDEGGAPYVLLRHYFNSQDSLIELKKPRGEVKLRRYTFLSALIESPRLFRMCCELLQATGAYGVFVGALWNSDGNMLLYDARGTKTSLGTFAELRQIEVPAPAVLLGQINEKMAYMAEQLPGLHQVDAMNELLADAFTLQRALDLNERDELGRVAQTPRNILKIVEHVGVGYEAIEVLMYSFADRAWGRWSGNLQGPLAIQDWVPEPNMVGFAAPTAALEVGRSDLTQLLFMLSAVEFNQLVLLPRTAAWDSVKWVRDGLEGNATIFCNDVGGEILFRILDHNQQLSLLA